MNAFHSVYLSGASQLKFDCFNTGPPSLGPDALVIFWVCISAIVWIAILVASATVFVITSLIICSAILTFIKT